MKCILLKYFNEKGSCLHQLGMEDVGHLDGNAAEDTSHKQGAYAVQALINQVTTEQMSIHFAREVRSVSIENRKPVAIADVLPELETTFGATSLQWARAIFTHLELKPPTLQ